MLSTSYSGSSPPDVNTGVRCKGIAPLWRLSKLMWKVGWTLESSEGKSSVYETGVT